MACGIAVVGSDSAEIPSVIGEAGRVVPEGDPYHLGVALRELAVSSDERTALGSQGRSRVLGQFTHEQISVRTIDFLFDLVNS
jgi:glycosyltransferase involved in cell wall biosynthesis